jgi:hypothetical protein
MIGKMKPKPLSFPRKNLTGLHLFICIIALVAGGIIYLLFRPGEVLLFHWMRTLGFDHLISYFRQISFSIKLHLPEWIVYSLPNGLWAFAYALLITRIWAGSKSGFRYLWIASIPALVLGYEILQFTGTIPGTFCFQDIILGTAGMTLGIILGTNSQQTKNHENKME